MNFNEFLKNNRAEYILPLGGPTVIFIISAFVTNIGWLAIPAWLAVAVIVSALKTFELYHRWHTVETLITAIKADGRLISDD